MKRCDWAPKNNPLYCKYHDEEWGVPVHSERKLFEMLILEGAQAGLSWSTILKKRENYRNAFDDFNYKKIASYKENKIKILLNDAGIVRNKLKIKSAVQNAKIFIRIQKEFGSFDKYIWGFVKFKPICNNIKSLNEIPVKTELSDKISKDLKKRGMNFVGPIIIYSYLQAVGIVNDHQVGCFRYKSVC